VPEYGHGRAVPAGSERLQAEVNADLAGPCGELIRDLALEVDVSAPARVRTKTGLDLAPISRDSQNWYRRLRVGDIGTVDLYGAPATHQGSSWRSASRGRVESYPPSGKLPADGLYGVGVEAELGGVSSAELDPIEGGQPFALPLHRVPVNLAAVVPDVVARACRIRCRRVEPSLTRYL